MSKDEFFEKRIIVPKKLSRDGWYSRGYLPHFGDEGLTQNVCFRLFDSMPKEMLEFWREELKHLPPKEYDLERRKRIDSYLDNGYGSCFLRDRRVAKKVQDALWHFDGERYFLHAWCVMPNHVHVLFTPETGYEVGGISHSWKSFTAHECNKLLGRTGSFWQKEPYDRYIRNEQHFRKAIAYIENNPVKAGLCEQPEDWPWSSAHWSKKAEEET